MMGSVHGPPARGLSVLLVSTSLGAGGAEKQLVYLANHLVQEFDVEIRILNLDTFRTKDLDARVTFVMSGIQTGTFQKKTLAAVLGTLKSIRSSRANLIISFSYHAQLFVWMSSLFQSKKVPLIISERSDEMGSLGRRIVRFFAFRRATVITANSQSALNRIARFPNLPGKKLRLTPNYLAPSNSKVITQAPNEAFTWVCVARFSEEKNHNLLLSAASLLQNAGFLFRLRLIGDGPLRPQLEEVVKRQGLDEIVDFFGVCNNVPEILARSDAFVLTSKFEGTPNSILEACMARLPIVSTPAGDIFSLVSASNIPFIVKNWDPESLSVAMMSVMKLSKNERARIGAANKISIEKNFCNEGNLRVWNDLIEEFIPHSN